MTPQQPLTVTVTRQYNASAERVFDAWLDPKRAGQWLFATDEGEMIRVEIDPRVGGHFLFVDRRKEGDAEHYGTYVEIDRPRRLVFDFSVENYDKDVTRVAIEIEPLEVGCELTLTHEGVPGEYTSQTRDGWKMILGNLGRSI